MAADDQPVEQPQPSGEGGGGGSENERFSNDDRYLNEQMDSERRETEERVAREASENLAAEGGGVENMQEQCHQCAALKNAQDNWSTNIIEATAGQGQFDAAMRAGQLPTDNQELYRLAEQGQLVLPTSDLSQFNPNLPRQRGGAPADAGAPAGQTDAGAVTPGAAAEAPPNGSPEANNAAPATPTDTQPTPVADQIQRPADQMPQPTDQSPVAGDAGLPVAMRAPNRGPGGAGGDRAMDIPEGWGRQPDANDGNRRELTAQDTPAGVLETMRTSGASEQQIRDMQTYLDQMQRNLGGRGLTPDQITEQMNRSSAALNDMLRGRDADGDGQLDGPLGARASDRINMALSAAGSVADTRTMNQAGTNECALTSINRAAVSGNNPAAALEGAASAVNRGGFYSPNGAWTDLAAVTAGMQPSDHTGSSTMFNPQFHSGNQMNLFLQVRNQMVGERMAQYDGGHYQAANAGTRTGEQFTDRNGNRTHESPNTTANNTARALHEFTGQRLLMHSSMARELSGNPPSPHIATFSNEQEFRAAMDANLRASGSRDNPMWNRASYLPGEGNNGHPDHDHHLVSAMNNADGTMGIRNNWGAQHNHNSVSYDQMDRATNLDRQRGEPGGGGNDGPRYNTDTRAEPGDKPNREKLDELNRNADKKKQEEDEAQKKAREAKEKARAELEAANEAAAVAEYGQALAQWQNSPADQRGEKPSLETFRRRHTSH